MTASSPHSERITDWTWQVGTVRSAIDTLTAVSHREEVDDAELHENSLNAYAALDWLAAEHERLEEQLQAAQDDHEATTERLRERRDENTRLLEQFGVLQEKARRLLVATGGPPEKIEDVGKARRELVDALHASYPAKSPEASERDAGELGRVQVEGAGESGSVTRARSEASAPKGKHYVFSAQDLEQGKVRFDGPDRYCPICGTARGFNHVSPCPANQERQPE